MWNRLILECRYVEQAYFGMQICGAGLFWNVDTWSRLILECRYVEQAYFGM
jgi:hypothetical protein